MPHDSPARRDQGAALPSGGHSAGSIRFVNDGSGDLQASMYHRERSRLQVGAHQKRHKETLLFSVGAVLCCINFLMAYHVS